MALHNTRRPGAVVPPPSPVSPTPPAAAIPGAAIAIPQPMPSFMQLTTELVAQGVHDLIVYSDQVRTDVNIEAGRRFEETPALRVFAALFLCVAFGLVLYTANRTYQRVFGPIRR